MANNYDNAAWFYERLSKLVFRQAQVKAQSFFLPRIKPGSRILIVGGGTGQILELLTRLHPSGLQITYVEISARMMRLSKKRDIGQNAITYINQSINEAKLGQDFDVIITAFLFDNFSQSTFKSVFAQINNYLQAGGLWLDTDFQLTGQLWQKALLKSMYLFFKLLCGVETMQLPDINKAFGLNYDLLQKKEFYGRFISARLYQKAIKNPITPTH